MAWKGQAWAPPVTSIFYDDANQRAPREYVLHWQPTQQPDLGGALNYSWRTKQAPIKEMLGTAIAFRTPWRAITPQLVPLQMRPDAGMGVFVGQFMHQPLTDVNGPNPGGLTGMPPNLTQGLA